MKIKTCLALLLLMCRQIHAQTYDALVNQVIPDDGSIVTFDISVSGLPEAIDTLFGLESVCLNITHTWDSDLKLKLIAPDGTVVLLFEGVGADGDNFTNTCLSGQADIKINTVSPPFTGTFIPMGDMGLINNNLDPNGIWKLQCQDTYPQDEGVLLNWGITFGDNPAVPFPFTESNLPIILINTYGQEIFTEPKIEAGIKIIDNGPGIMNHPTDTNYAYEGKILTELQGFTAPYHPKKNYDFDLIDEDSLEIDTVLLGLPSENDFILKGEYVDYSLMKNTITYEMSRRMGRYAPRTKFCEVLLNNEYIGVFVLTEKIKRDSNRIDIATLNPEDTTGDELTGGYIIEINENYEPNDWNSIYPPINDITCDFPVAFKMVDPQIEVIQSQQLEYIHNYVDSFENALHSDYFLDADSGYRHFISVKSFIDFMIVNEFSANYDSYGRSTFLYKEKVTDGGQLNIGPPWDYDRAFAPGTEEGWVWEITHPYWPFPFWWSKFREDPEWVNEVYCRYNSLRENILLEDSFYELIDSLQLLLKEPAKRNFSKWAELGVGDPAYFVDELKIFIGNRLPWIDGALAADAVTAPDASFTVEEISNMFFAFTPALDGAKYSWDFGDGFHSTEQFPNHQYAATGLYTVALTVDKYYGCTASSDYTIDLSSGLLQLPENELLIYPSPFSDQLSIKFPAQGKNIEIALINNLGEVLMKEQFESGQDIVLFTNHLPAGMYIVKLCDGTNIRFQAVVKNQVK